MKHYDNYIEYLKQNKDVFDFAWLTVDQMHLIEGYKQTSWEDNQNIFLQNTKDNKAALAESVIKYGMIFPFFSRYVNGKDWVILGNHRLMSLKSVADKLGNKEFLCIRLPDAYFIDDSFKTQGLEIKVLKKYPSLINDKAYREIGNAFVPFIGFNDKDALEEWLG